MNLQSAPSYDDPSLSLFSLQPSFYQREDDFYSCNLGPFISEEVFEKFNLDCLTPPRSPELLNSVETVPSRDFDLSIDSYFTKPCTYSEETLRNDFYSHFRSIPEFPDLKDACNEYFDTSNPVFEDVEYKEETKSKIKTDCMWSGIGHKPHATSVRLGRNSPSNCPGTPVVGCVNPQSVFSCNPPYGVNEPKITCSPRRLKVVDGLETPSDSEEEIDVVTVEKKSPNRQTILANGRAIVGTLVHQRNDVCPQLSLITKNTQGKENWCRYGNQLEKTSSGSPKMALVINDTNGCSAPKKVNYQLKRIPFVSASASKKRVKSADGKSNTVVHLMRLSPSSVSVQQKEELQFDEEDSCTRIKRRVLSLDGVSMVTDTGINRFRNKKHDFKKLDAVNKNTVFHVQTSKVEKLDRKKPVRRFTKKVASIPVAAYETPLSSPSSLTGDGPHSPLTKKDSSSGSEEESSIRAAHNVLERQRREGLRTLFNTLKAAVPELQETDRAPKVAILKKSRDHILALQKESACLKIEKNDCEKTRCSLQQQLRELASDFTSVGAFTRLTKSTSCSTDLHRSSVLDQYSLYVN